MPGPDTWHQPERPQHPHFTALALTAMAIDAYATENPNTTTIRIPGGTTINLDDLGDRPQHDSTETINATTPNSKQDTLGVRELAACWHVGLNAGLSDTRGISLTNPFLQPLTRTIDQESLAYMARARATTALQHRDGQPDQVLPAAMWLDGYLTGRGLDATLADLTDRP
jgi:hypothetical protein